MVPFTDTASELSALDLILERHGIFCGSEPVAMFSIEPEVIFVNETVHFDASASSAVAGEVVAYSWQFGDGATAEGVAPNHVFTSPGEFLVEL